MDNFMMSSMATKTKEHIELDFFPDVLHISNFLSIYEFNNECISFISMKEKSSYTNEANVHHEENMDLYVGG